jgi:hypothetical protein
MIDTEIDWASNIRSLISEVGYQIRHYVHFLQAMVLTLLFVGVFIGSLFGLVWLYDNLFEVFIGVSVCISIGIMASLLTAFFGFEDDYDWL